MINKILIVNKTPYISDFLKDKLSSYDIEIIKTKDSIDGLIKMRNVKPDLIIIDYDILQQDKMNFLKEKHQLKSTIEIPIIIMYSKEDKLDKNTILELAKYRLYKLLQKPIEMDLLFKVIGEILNIRIEIDLNPCMININVINDVLVVKVANGLNQQKIDLMKYKIIELMGVNKVKFNKVLVVMSEIGFQEFLDKSLNLILKNILDCANILISGIHLITDINYIKEFYLSHPKYRFIEISDDLNVLLDNINRVEVKNYFKQKKDDIILAKKDFTVNNEITLNLNFSTDKINESLIDSSNILKDKKFNIAVVDDDLSILELMEVILLNNNWNVNLYEDGSLFIDDLKNNKPDLIFLDLIMPSINGFEVLEYLSLNKIDIPVIVMSSLTDKRFIFKARSFGIAYYLTKPVKPNIIIEKAEEVLKNKILSDEVREIRKVKKNVENTLIDNNHIFI